MHASGCGASLFALKLVDKYMEFIFDELHIDYVEINIALMLELNITGIKYTFVCSEYTQQHCEQTPQIWDFCNKHIYNIYIAIEQLPY